MKRTKELRLEGHIDFTPLASPSQGSENPDLAGFPTSFYGATVTKVLGLQKRFRGENVDSLLSPSLTSPAQPSATKENAVSRLKIM